LQPLAEKVGMSPRNFARVFTRQVGIPPGRFVERARHYFEQTQEPISRVAQRCGYSTAEGMRLTFDRHLGISPRDYRRRSTTAAV
jgi:transcriptional regulator GlxA family with amidase domain